MERDEWKNLGLANVDGKSSTTAKQEETTANTNGSTPPK